MNTIRELWDRHGLMLSARAASLFSLPIEGGFWSSVMGEHWAAQACAYALPFTLDLVADLVVYRYGRIQQTVVKGTKKWKASRYIVWFAVFNAVASWGTSAWQLNSAMQPVKVLWPLLFAFVQPVMGAAVSYTQAVQDGKYDEQTPIKDEQPEQIRIQGKPDLDWWLDKVDSLNGDGEQVTPERVRELCLAEYTETPSGTTLYNWARRAQDHHAPERVREGE
jgi:hypothetical protein